MEKWKQRGIRMPDDLWFECMKQAKIRGLNTSEWVRKTLEIALIELGGK